MSDVSIEQEAPWAAGLRSARANLLPGFILQGLALALVVAFYRHAPTHALLRICSGGPPAMTVSAPCFEARMEE